MQATIRPCPTSYPTSARHSAGTWSKVFAGSSHSESVLRTAKLAGLPRAKVVMAQVAYDDLCNTQDRCGDGRLGAVGADDLLTMAGLYGEIDAQLWQHAALRGGLLVRGARGIFHNAGYQLRNTDERRHLRARQLRAEDIAAIKRGHNRDRMARSRQLLVAASGAFAGPTHDRGGYWRTNKPQPPPQPPSPSIQSPTGGGYWRTKSAHPSQNGHIRPTEALCGTSPHLNSTGQRSDADRLAEADDRPKPHGAGWAERMSGLKNGKNLPAGGPRTAQLRPHGPPPAQPQPATAESLPATARHGSCGPMQPPDTFDEGYMAAVMADDRGAAGPHGQRHRQPTKAALVGGGQGQLPQAAPVASGGAVAVASRPQAQVHRPSPAERPSGAVAATTAPTRPTPQQMAPADPWAKYAKPQAGRPQPVAHCVVSPSTPASEVRHTTPSPAASCEESDRAARQSFLAAEAAKRRAHQLSPEHEHSLELGRKAVADILAKMRF